MNHKLKIDVSNWGCFEIRNKNDVLSGHVSHWIDNLLRSCKIRVPSLQHLQVVVEEKTCSFFALNRGKSSRIEAELTVKRDGMCPKVILT